MTRQNQDHDINHGENQFNAAPVINWALYRAEQPTLTLKRRNHETPEKTPEARHR